MSVQSSTAMNSDSAARPCPVCLSPGPREILHRQRFVEGPLGDGYDVVICGNCGAGFADGIPSQAELDRYYADRSKYTYAHAGGAESPYDFRRFELIADQIEPHLPSKSARILDIGCATGGLLAILQKRGYANVLGSDPSPECAAAAKRLHGLDVRTATLVEHAAWTDRFDAVILVGVLEHLRDVQEAVKAASSLLRPGGLLYCAQPDVESFADCVNAPYQQFSTEHVNFFSANSLQWLMAQSGLQPQTTWHWMVEWREGITDSVVSGLFGRTRQPLPPPLRDATSERGLRAYLTQSAISDEAGGTGLQEVVATQEPLLVWGAGTQTRRMLASGTLAAANIVAFVDSNPALQGNSLAGRKIVAPRDLIGRPEAILICSEAFQAEIIHAIRVELKLPNRLVLLDG